MNEIICFLIRRQMWYKLKAYTRNTESSFCAIRTLVVLTHLCQKKNNNVATVLQQECGIYSYRHWWKKASNSTQTWKLWRSKEIRLPKFSLQYLKIYENMLNTCFELWCWIILWTAKVWISNKKNSNIFLEHVFLQH